MGRVDGMTRGVCSGLDEEGGECGKQEEGEKKTHWERRERREEREKGERTEEGVRQE